MVSVAFLLSTAVSLGLIAILSSKIATFLFKPKPTRPHPRVVAIHWKNPKQLEKLWQEAASSIISVQQSGNQTAIQYQPYLNGPIRSIVVPTTFYRSRRKLPKKEL